MSNPYPNYKRNTITLPVAEQPAQPQQESVGSLSVRYHRGFKSMTNTDFDYNGDLPEGDYELYASPPAQRKPLTDDEIIEIAEGYGDIVWQASSAIDFARAIEAALGIKGNT